MPNAARHPAPVESTEVDPRRRGAHLRILALLLLIILALPARAAEILIVKASDADPYTQAESALRERLLEHHHAVRTILMKEASERGLDVALARADTVIA